ncbi:MAG: hypothetical protein WC804_04535 [Sphingomonas sp.]|jgi:hypothetical protein|uniref:hypothetical protein n=1 Tax=Sphingomonas sp. TaxID=28214 RepID=UPI003567BC62
MLLSLIIQATAQLVMPPPLPADWATLAPLPYLAPPQVTPAMEQFVAGEVAAKRCAEPKPVNGRYVLHIDIATLIGSDGTIRKAMPRAIGCPTVEQYSAGLVIGFARGNLPARGAGAGDQWYRTTLVYDWGK